MHKRIGITGGIGSGKTTVCRLFETLGIPVYYADYWAKWLIINDEAVKNGIIELFGAAAYTPDGAYNRAYVGEIAFNNPDKLQQLNALVHPAVERHSRQWHAEQPAVPYTLKEAALMIESGSHQFLDGLIVVTAPESVRIERVMARDGITEAEVRARIRNQLPEADKVALANWVINNDGQQLIIPQVQQIHALIKR